jgi:hypothetical protein
MEFIEKHIANTSLDLQGRDIREFIKVQDLQPLVLGLIKAMKPNGYAFTKTCINSLELDEQGTPKCNFTVTGTVDPEKMLWVNTAALTEKMISHMSKRAPKTVSIDEVIEYQKNLQVNNDKIVSIKDDIGNSYNFKLSIPSLETYINSGEEWVLKVNKLIVDAVTDNKNEDEDEIFNRILKTVILGIYKHFITEVEFSDHTIVKDKDTLSELIEVMSASDVLVNSLIAEIRKYIDDYAIAVVGTTNYVCPACGSVQREDDGTVLRNIIPLDVVKNFFDLSALKVAKIERRS